MRPSWLSISELTWIWSRSTFQSNMASPQPVIARARRSESAPRKFDTFDPEKAFCITVKPISMTISTRPPISPGAARSLVEGPGDREARAGDPDEQQEPGRDQHHRPVGAARRHVEDEDEADAGDGGDRDARDAGGDRRIVDRQRHDRRHQQQPDRGDMRIAHVPAPQIEIGEQEDDQRRAERRLDAGAPYALGFVLEAEYLAPETEIDADIGEHRPGQRRGGGKDQGAPDDEDDRQEQAPAGRRCR